MKHDANRAPGGECAASPDPPSASLDARYAVIGVLASSAACRILHVRGRGDAQGAQAVAKQTALGGLSAEERSAIVDEALRVCAVRSAHVVRHLDAFVEAGWLHVVSVHVKKGDLGTMLTRRAGEALSEGMVWGLLGGMLRGLRDLHDHNLVHRDIKPSNVFIGEKGEALLGDLGLARRRAPAEPARADGSGWAESSSGANSSSSGSVLYAAPEVCSGGTHGAPADVWAVGCIAYQLASGRPPFLAANGRVLSRRIQHTEPAELPSHCSPQLGLVIFDMLRKAPDRRPTARALLEGAHTLRLALHGAAPQQPHQQPQQPQHPQQPQYAQKQMRAAQPACGAEHLGSEPPAQPLAAPLEWSTPTRKTAGRAIHTPAPSSTRSSGWGEELSPVRAARAAVAGSRAAGCSDGAAPDAALRRGLPLGPMEDGSPAAEGAAQPIRLATAPQRGGASALGRDSEEAPGAAPSDGSPLLPTTVAWGARALEPGRALSLRSAARQQLLQPRLNSGRALEDAARASAEEGSEEEELEEGEVPRSVPARAQRAAEPQLRARPRALSFAAAAAADEEEEPQLQQQPPQQQQQQPQTRLALPPSRARKAWHEEEDSGSSDGFDDEPLLVAHPSEMRAAMRAQGSSLRHAAHERASAAPLHAAQQERHAAAAWRARPDSAPAGGVAERAGAADGSVAELLAREEALRLRNEALEGELARQRQLMARQMLAVAEQRSAALEGAEVLRAATEALRRKEAALEAQRLALLRAQRPQSPPAARAKEASAPGGGGGGELRTASLLLPPSPPAPGRAASAPAPLPQPPATRPGSAPVRGAHAGSAAAALAPARPPEGEGAPPSRQPAWEAMSAEQARLVEPPSGPRGAARGSSPWYGGELLPRDHPPGSSALAPAAQPRSLSSTAADGGRAPQASSSLANRPILLTSPPAFASPAHLGAAAAHRHGHPSVRGSASEQRGPPHQARRAPAATRAASGARSAGAAAVPRPLPSALTGAQVWRPTVSSAARAHATRSARLGGGEGGGEQQQPQPQQPPPFQLAPPSGAAAAARQGGATAGAHLQPRAAGAAGKRSAPSPFEAAGERADVLAPRLLSPAQASVHAHAALPPSAPQTAARLPAGAAALRAAHPPDVAAPPAPAASEALALRPSTATAPPGGALQPLPTPTTAGDDDAATGAAGGGEERRIASAALTQLGDARARGARRALPGGGRGADGAENAPPHGERSRSASRRLNKLMDAAQREHEAESGRTSPAVEASWPADNGKGAGYGRATAEADGWPGGDQAAVRVPAAADPELGWATDKEAAILELRRLRALAPAR